MTFHQHVFIQNYKTIEAFRRDEISRGKLKELVLMVGLSANEIDRLLESVGLADDPGKRPET